MQRTDRVSAVTCGICVDLPQPVPPATTVTSLVEMVCKSESRAASAGSFWRPGCIRSHAGDFCCASNAACRSLPCCCAPLTGLGRLFVLVVADADRRTLPTSPPPHSTNPATRNASATEREQSIKSNDSTCSSYLDSHRLTRPASGRLRPVAVRPALAAPG